MIFEEGNRDTDPSMTENDFKKLNQRKIQTPFLSVFWSVVHQMIVLVDVQKCLFLLLQIFCPEKCVVKKIGQRNCGKKNFGCKILCTDKIFETKQVLGQKFEPNIVGGWLVGV